MTLNEVFDSGSDRAIARLVYQSLRNYNSQESLNANRKTRLTLRQLNLLRRMRDARNLDHETKMSYLRRQYVNIPTKKLRHHKKYY